MRFVAALAATAALAVLCGSRLCAQGPLYRERWTDLHLELLRERVFAEMSGRDAALRQRVAEHLAGGDGGVPFRRPTEALAMLRGVAPDDEFRFRASLGSFLLPEVADPVGANELCRRVNVSVFQPQTLPIPGKVTFLVDVSDPAGEQVFRGSIDPVEPIGIELLRTGKASLSIPAGELPDGAYRVRVSALFDDAGPRPGDLLLEHTMHVLRGYQQRAEAVQARADQLADSLSPIDRALLLGMTAEVNRAYLGEAFCGESSAVADLERAELAVANAQAARRPIDGMTGPVPTALPSGGGELLYAVLRLPAPPADGTEPPHRPLVVIAGGAPASDTTGRRPSAPAYRTARWVQRRVGDLGLPQDCLVVWLQSPGPGVPYGKAMPTALRALHELLPGDGRTVLVLELHAAVAMLYSGGNLGELCDGVALVGGGTLGKPQLAALGSTAILGVPLTGHPSSRGLQLSADYAAGKYGEVEWSGSFRLLPDAPRPWTAGAAAAGREVGAFVREVLGL